MGWEGGRKAFASEREGSARRLFFRLPHFFPHRARAAFHFITRARRRAGPASAQSPRPATRRNGSGLTARELDVLRLLAEGLRNAAIAERLFLSSRTIDYHVSALLRKLDARSRGEAVAAARRLGLLENR